MDVLAGNGGSYRVCFLDGSFRAGTFELGGFLLQASSDCTFVSVVKFAGLDGGHVVNMLLGKNLTVLYRLDGGMVVILVDLTVNGGRGLLMTLFDDVLLHHGRCYFLVNGGVMVTGLAPVVPSLARQGGGKKAGWRVRWKRC